MIAYDDLKQTAGLSAYQPSEEVLKLIAHVQQDYKIGDDILNSPARELNYYSVIERMNKDQRTFNALVDESSEDPHEAWKWRGTRSTARKKTMAMHAHLTAEYVVPTYFPDNEGQKVDREVGEVMRDGVEWMTIHSNYRASFMLASLGMLVNPVTYLTADYYKVTQTIKEKVDQGYVEKKVIDDVLSGFQATVKSADQVLLTNQYIQETQRQVCLVERRYISYSEAEAIYQNHENWPYVQKGIRSVFSADDGLFYDVKDDEHMTQVEESIHKCRRKDCEEPFINGIYMGNMDNVDWNPIRHRDNEGKPKYNIVPFGYQRISEHYYFFKSQVNLLSWDDQLIDAMYEIQMNREFLELDPPTVTSGEDKLDTSVIFPGANFASSNKDLSIKPILPPSTGNGYRAISFAEQSASDESLAPTEMGALPDASQKAYTVAQASANAKILLGSAQKSLGQSVAEFGYLMGDIFINHFTTPQLDEITNNVSYRQFVLEDQMVNGKKVSKRIRFDESLDNMSQDDQNAYKMKLLTEVGYPDHKEEIMALNPILFSKLKYICYCEPDLIGPKNKKYAMEVAEKVYTLTSKDPYANGEALLRNFFNEVYPKQADELMAKNPQVIGAGQPMQPGGGMPSALPQGAPPIPSLQ